MRNRVPRLLTGLLQGVRSQQHGCAHSRAAVASSSHVLDISLGSFYIIEDAANSLKLLDRVHQSRLLHTTSTSHDADASSPQPASPRPRADPLPTLEQLAALSMQDFAQHLHDTRYGMPSVYPLASHEERARLLTMERIARHVPASFQASSTSGLEQHQLQAISAVAGTSPQQVQQCVAAYQLFLKAHQALLQQRQQQQAQGSSSDTSQHWHVFADATVLGLAEYVEQAVQGQPTLFEISGSPQDRRLAIKRLQQLADVLRCMDFAQHTRLVLPTARRVKQVAERVGLGMGEVERSLKDFLTVRRLAFAVAQLVAAGAPWPSSVQQADDIMARVAAQQQRQAGPAAPHPQQQQQQQQGEEEELEVPEEVKLEAQYMARMFRRHASLGLPAYLQHLGEARHRQQQQQQQAGAGPVSPKAAYAARRQMIFDERVLGSLLEQEQRKLAAAVERAVRRQQQQQEGQPLRWEQVMAAADVRSVAARCGVPEEAVQNAVANYARFRGQAVVWARWAEDVAAGAVRPPPGMPKSAAEASALPPEVLGMMQGVQQEQQQQQGDGEEEQAVVAGGGGDEFDGQEVHLGRRLPAAAVRMMEGRRAAEMAARGERVRRPRRRRR